jgi:hypothetical protein
MISCKLGTFYINGIQFLCSFIILCMCLVIRETPVSPLRDIV